jgi:DNA-binding PadR family transcriptional regulator
LLWALGQGRAHGAQLVARLRARTDGAVFIPDGTLYPTLRALVTAELATEVRDNGRRQFELTAAGQAKLDHATAVIVALFGRSKRIGKVR